MKRNSVHGNFGLARRSRMVIALLGLGACGCASPRAPGEVSAPRGPGLAPVVGAAVGGGVGAAADGPVAAAGGALAGALVGGMLEVGAQDRLEAVRREAHDAGRREERQRLAEHWWAEATQGSPPLRLAGPDPDGTVAVPAGIAGGLRYAPHRRPAGDPNKVREPIRGNKRIHP